MLLPPPWYHTHVFKFRTHNGWDFMVYWIKKIKVVSRWDSFALLMRWNVKHFCAHANKKHKIILYIFMHTTTYSQRTLKAFLAGKQKQKERKIKKRIDRLVDTCDACSCSICYPVVSSERYAHFFYRSELHCKTEGGGGGGGGGGQILPCSVSSCNRFTREKSTMKGKTAMQKHVDLPKGVIFPGRNSTISPFFPVGNSTKEIS